MMFPSVWWLAALALAGAAAWMDYRYRITPNRMWKLALAVIAPAILVEAIVSPAAAGVRLLNGVLTAPVIYGLWRVKAFRGGDAKGLMVFAFLLSPYGYMDVAAARIYPLFDVVLPALVAGQIYWLRSHDNRSPFFVVFLASLAVVAAIGNPILYVFQVLVDVFL